MTTNIPTNIETTLFYQTEKFAKKVIFKNEKSSIMMMAFSAGQGLPAHTTPVDAYVMVLDGEGHFTIGETPHLVKEGESLVLPKDILHTVQAEQNFKMLLIR